TIVRAMIERIYEQFVKRVVDSRKLTVEQVDAIGGGRVWTGLQAKANGLVDELGGLDVALKQARERAKLPDDAPLIVFQGDEMPLAPQLAAKLNPAAGLQYLYTGLRKTLNGSVQMLLPFKID
ncbi:MAG: S49 family peptidase, partial [Anaerolineae bacterium]|nr:S49 family peptidase [Anaerolineae bacterium]